MAERTKRSVLVTGGTGHQGGAVARALLMRGHAVRVFTRFPSSDGAVRLRQLGAEIAHGDFENEASLEHAMENVRTVFAMGTPYEGGPGTEVEEVTHIFDAAEKKRVGHIVYSSVASADRQTGIPHFESKHQLERELRARALPFTIVAPVWFMENLFGYPTLSRGYFSYGIPGARRLQQAALNDLAHLVAEVIEQREPYLGERIEVASDELAGDEVARIISRAAGVDISYSTQSPDEAAAHLGEGYSKMLRWMIEAGFDVDIAALKARFPEVRFHSFGDWAREQDWSFLVEARKRGAAGAAGAGAHR